MMTLRKRHTAGFRISLAAGLIVLFAAAPPARSETEALTVMLDRAQLVKLPDRVATLVIGNPMIVDASLQGGNTVVLTGKGFGETNMMALDRNGDVLFEKIVQVQAPTEAVTVYRGVNRQTYSCAPVCGPQIMLGDADETFKNNLAQTTTRNAAAQAAAQAVSR